MGKQKNQSGSAHLVVVIILTLALIGSVGYIFYDKFIAKENSSVVKNDDTEKETNNNVVKEVQLTKIAYDQSMNSGLAVKYPSDWVNVHKNAANVGSQTEVQTTDTNTITSPDGNTVVEMVVGIRGVGGTCESDDDIKVVYIEAFPIKNYSGMSLFTQVNHNITQGTYGYFVDVLSNDYNNQQVGYGPACSFGFFQTYNKETSYLKIKLNNVENGKVTTLADFQNAIKTDDFATAKLIAQSLYIK